MVYLLNKTSYKIILSFGHCLPKLINGGGGGLDKGRGG